MCIRDRYDGERGTFTLNLSPSDVTALQLPNLDCLFLTGAHIVLNKVSIVPKAAAGIVSVEAATGAAAEGEAEYYDLTGRRVTAPAAGVYIRVEGGRATKVLR